MTPEKFRSIRKDTLKLTQAELAKTLGCAPKRIWEIENRAGGIKNETTYAMYWLAFHGPKLPEIQT